MSHMSCPNVWKMCRTADWTTWHPRNGTGSDMCIMWLCASIFSVHCKYWNDLNWKFPQPVGCRLCESLARWVGSKPTIPCWSRSNCSRLHWSFEALEINQKNRSTKVAKECKCWARLCYRRGDLPSLWIRVGRKHTTCRISCRQHSPYPSETKIYWCYLQLWHRLHTPSTSQTFIARVLGGLDIYYVKLLLIGLHMDRKQHFHEVWRGDIKRLVLLLGKWENKEISGGVCKDLWKISKTNYST